MQLHFVKCTATITHITSFGLLRASVLSFKSLVHIEPVTDINLKRSVKIHIKMNLNVQLRYAYSVQKFLVYINSSIHKYINVLFIKDFS